MTSTLIDEYLDRIGLPEFKDRLPAAGDTDPVLDRDDLNAIVGHHSSSIPFESISPFIGRGVNCDLKGISDKLVRSNRGGYCHEHAPLLQYALNTFNVSTRSVMARVYATDDPDEALRTHLTTLVTIPSGRFLIDPGFGGNTPTVVVPDSESPETVETPFGDFRIREAREGLTDDLLLDTERILEYKSKSGDTFRTLYGFSYAPVTRSDIEVANWYTGSCPGGLFTESLIACAYSDDGDKYTLTNWKLREVSTAKGTNTTTKITSFEQYLDCLNEKFGIVPDAEAIAAIEKRLATVGNEDVNI